MAYFTGSNSENFGYADILKGSNPSGDGRFSTDNFAPVNLETYVYLTCNDPDYLFHYWEELALLELIESNCDDDVTAPFYGDLA